LEQEINNGTEILINTKNFQVRVIRHNNDSVKAMPSFIDGREFGATNEDAYELLKELFNEDSPFQYSKPKNLVAKLILANSYFNKTITILDFFAGSGTTLHATMQLNAEDGGHRQCILVTNNENQICENVTYERNRRVIQGYTTPKGEAVAGLSSNNLRYYKTDFIPREQTARNKRALVAAATDLLCIRNDIYTESKEFGVKRLRADVARYFSDGKQQMLIIYNEEAIPAFVEEISRMTDDSKIKVYVFAAGNYAYDDEFEEVTDKVTICALPAAIYNAYQKVLPKKRAKMLDEANTADVENANGELNFQEE
jgi:adenine-specific DNA-methyltransferase